MSINAPLTLCYQAQRIIVAYSGGVDSHVLLHYIAQIPELKSKIIAIYVHHGLQQCADDWTLHCEKVAFELGVHFKSIDVNAQAKQGESPEEAARNARYKVLKLQLFAGDCVVFAQHREDQLETVLLQLFRGAGLKGLSGMPVDSEFGKGRLLRPLLDVSQEAILTYAEQQHLKWVEDPSNKNRQFDRNYLRYEVLPLLAQRWPSLDKTISRSARHCAAAQHLLSKIAHQQMLACYDLETKSLNIDILLGFSFAEQQWIVREWLAMLKQRMPREQYVFEILNALVMHTQIKLDYDGVCIQRYRNQLYCLMPKDGIDAMYCVNWLDKGEALLLANNGFLSLETTITGISQKFVNTELWQVRYRQGGEKIKLANRVGHHRLKSLYQEAAIEPWLRPRIPLIYIKGQLAVIGNLWIAADFLALKGEPAFSINWQK